MSRLPLSRAHSAPPAYGLIGVHVPRLLVSPPWRIPCLPIGDPRPAATRCASLLVRPLAASRIRRSCSPFPRYPVAVWFVPGLYPVTPAHQPLRLIYSSTQVHTSTRGLRFVGCCAWWSGSGMSSSSTTAADGRAGGIHSRTRQQAVSAKMIGIIGAIRGSRTRARLPVYKRPVIAAAVFPCGHARSASWARSPQCGHTGPWPNRPTARRQPSRQPAYPPGRQAIPAATGPPPSTWRYRAASREAYRRRCVWPCGR